MTNQFSTMFPTPQRLGGYLWKIPYKMSQLQKARQRKRLRAVDNVIATVGAALNAKNISLRKLDYLTSAAFPKESEMPAKDKYWIFSKYGRNYRKGAHRQPKFTKISNRTVPPGF